MIDRKALAEAYEKVMEEAREEGISEEEIHTIVAERLTEDVNREIGHYVDRRKWQRINAVNKAHFDN